MKEHVRIKKKFLEREQDQLRKWFNEFEVKNFGKMKYFH